MPHEQSIQYEELPTSVEDAEQMLREVARLGAQRMLQLALEAEVETYVSEHSSLVDEAGYRSVVRNGHAPQRTILTGVGPVEVSRPRVDERKAVKNDPTRERFTSGVFPRFLRRTPSVEGVVAVLYLKGISTNDFDASLRAIYGEDAGGLSASTVSRRCSHQKSSTERPSNARRYSPGEC